MPDEPELRGWPFADLAPSTLVVPAGVPAADPDFEDGTPEADRTLRYWVSPPSLGERYTRDIGNTTVIEIYVRGEDAGLFLAYSLGFTEKVKHSDGPPIVYKLRRHLPLESPYNENQYLTELVLVGSGDWVPDEDNDNWPKWSWHRYRATFADAPYDIVSDADAAVLPDGTPDETVRYVERRNKPGARELEIPGVYLETDGGRLINANAWMIDRTVDHTYTWYEVPYDAYPARAIGKSIGRVNSVAFDEDDLNAQAGTMLFIGVGQDKTDYQTRGGIKTCSPIVYLFREKAEGWNTDLSPSLDPDVDASYEPVRWQKTGVGSVPTRRPIPSADLNKLFHPE